MNRTPKEKAELATKALVIIQTYVSRNGNQFSLNKVLRDNGLSNAEACMAYAILRILGITVKVDVPKVHSKHTWDVSTRVEAVSAREVKRAEKLIKEESERRAAERNGKATEAIDEVQNDENLNPAEVVNRLVLIIESLEQKVETLEAENQHLRGTSDRAASVLDRYEGVF